MAVSAVKVRDSTVRAGLNPVTPDFSSLAGIAGMCRWHCVSVECASERESESSKSVKGYSAELGLSYGDQMWGWEHKGLI